MSIRTNDSIKRTASLGSFLRFTVPMIVNGHEMPADVKQEALPVPMSTFFEVYLHNINLEPCYQRQSVWSKAQNQAFVQSCFNKHMAIPPFYLCKRKKRLGKFIYDALDCRQRCTALSRFLEDEFPITVFSECEGEDGLVTKNRHRMYWSDINGTEELVEVKTDFITRTLPVVIFEPLGYDNQRKIFVGLNNGTPLNTDEQNYCPNYLARGVLDRAFDVVFRSTDAIPNLTDGVRDFGSGLASLIQSNVRDGKRFAHMRMIHESLILAAGVSGSKDDMTGEKYETGEPGPRGCKRQDRQYSAASMHGKLKSHGIDYDDIMADRAVFQKSLRVLKLDDTISNLRIFADFLAKVFCEDMEVGRTPARNREDNEGVLQPRNVIDPLCFLFALHANGFGLKKLLQVDKTLEWLRLYYPLKLKLDYNMATSDSYTMTNKYVVMGRLYEAMFEVEIPVWPSERSLESRSNWQIKSARIDKEVASAVERWRKISKR